MSSFILSLFPTAEDLKAFGNNALILGLVGDIAVLFIPSTKRILERTLAIVFILFIIGGVWMEHIADKALGTPRSLSLDAQARVAAKLCPFGPKVFDELVVAGSDTLFMGQVENVWKKCNWTAVGIQDRDRVASELADTVGVRFLYDPNRPDLRGAAEAYSAGLNSEGISATAEPAQTGMKLNRAAIHIVFGGRS